MLINLNLEVQVLLNSWTDMPTDIHDLCYLPLQQKTHPATSTLNLSVGMGNALTTS